MSRLILSVSGVVVAAMILGCCGAGNFSSAPAKPDAALSFPDPEDLSEKATTAVAVSARELAAKYKEQAAADAAYKEKWLVVDGEVEDAVASDRFVTFKAGASGFYVQCFFDAAWDGELGKLESGRPAKIGGRCTGRTGGKVVLKDCFFPDALPALMKEKKEREEAFKKVEEAKKEAEREAKEEEAKKKQEAEREAKEEARKPRHAVLQGKFEGQPICVAVSEAVQLRYAKYATESPADVGLRAIEQLYDDGLIYNVDGGTEVNVINHHGETRSEVQILEGSHKGEVGWVLRVCVKE